MLVGTTPWRSAPDGRRASRKRPVDASRRKNVEVAMVTCGDLNVGLS